MAIKITLKFITILFLVIARLNYINYQILIAD